MSLQPDIADCNETMMASFGKHVAYYRVSTARQGRSGLEAQRQAVADYLNGGDWKIVGEFTEVESGKTSDRPELAKALAMCRLHGARLVIAKLDRLSRNAHFLLGLKESGVDFVAADMPNANRLTVGIMAMVAPIIKELQAAGKTSLRAIAAGLNDAGIPTARGSEWSAVQVRRVLERLPL